MPRRICFANWGTESNRVQEQQIGPMTFRHIACMGSVIHRAFGRGIGLLTSIKAGCSYYLRKIHCVLCNAVRDQSIPKLNKNVRQSRETYPLVLQNSETRWQGN